MSTFYRYVSEVVLKKSLVRVNTYVRVMYYFYLTESVNINPCQPSPCGPNSQCREVNGQAVCSCAPSMVGAPPACRPECTISAECRLDQACSNQRCINPCVGACGFNAECKVVNHNPICTCPPPLTGDPFARCFILRKY